MIRISQKIIVLIVFFLSLFSCFSENADLIIPEEKLKAVFFDFHTAESIINRAPEDLKDSLKQVYQSQIFTIHDVQKSDFIHDIDIIAKDPKRFFALYEEIEKYGLDLKTSTVEGLNNELKSKE